MTCICQPFKINLHKEGDGIIRIYNSEGHIYCMYPYHLEKEANEHLLRLNNSLQPPAKSAEEIYAAMLGDSSTISSLTKARILEAMEIYANQLRK